MRLSPRLRAVAELALRGLPAADIGCDHAQLAAWWTTSGHVPHAIASDVAEGPLQRARMQLAEAGVTEVELRQGSGLTTLRPGEVATIALAGMGGHLMVELLEASPAVLAETRRVILQPNTGWEDVRRFLAERSIPLEAETLTEEGGQVYLTLAFDPRRRDASWSEADIVLGPRLRRTRAPVFERWFASRCAHVGGLIEALGVTLGSDHARVVALHDELDRLQRASDSTNCAT